MTEHLEGVVLIVRGELSTKTAPALDSLLDALVTSGERLLSIDLRDAHVLAPAGERLLERWGTTSGPDAGTYRFHRATARAPTPAT